RGPSSLVLREHRRRTRRRGRQRADRVQIGAELFVPLADADRLRHFFDQRSHDPQLMAPADIDEYVRACQQPGAGMGAYNDCQAGKQDPNRLGPGQEERQRRAWMTTTVPMRPSPEDKGTWRGSR